VALVAAAICLPAFAQQRPEALAALKPVPQSNRMGTDFNASVQLTGHIPRWVRPERLASKPVDQSAPVHLSIVLRRDPAVQAAFTQFLADQQDQASAHYHQWLTPEQIGDIFGPTPSDVAAVTDWVAGRGLKVESTSPGRTIVEVSGNAMTVGGALRTNFGYYTYNKTPVLTATTEPSIPSSLAPLIQSIEGLTQLSLESDIQLSSKLKPVGYAQPNYTDPNHSTYHVLGPGDFDVVYDLATLKTAGNTGATIGATRQHIAVIGRSRISATDLSYYEAAYNLPAVSPTVIIPPAGNDPGIATATNLAEPTLDVDRVIGTAPGAVTDLVVSGLVNGQDGLNVAASYEVNTLLDPILTISYGDCEASAGAASATNFWDSLFSSAAAEGITVLVSSGDAGAAGCDPYFSPPPSPQSVSPNLICASSYATCVGGTQFVDTTNNSTYWSSLDSASNVSVLSYIPEGAWNQTTNLTSAAGGGGVSTYIAKPSWQTGTGVPLDGFRDTPDIAFTASTYEGYLICLNSTSASDCLKNGPVVGGTSAAAPGMAGIVALLNTATGSRQGNLNPTIYRLAATTSSAFHDITVATSGATGCTLSVPSLCNNSVAGPTQGSSVGELPGYAVGTGYDQVTGWGSLDGGVFISVLSSPPSATTLGLTADHAITGGSQPPTFTATLSTQNTVSTPTGTVQFYSNGTSLGSPVTLTNNTATITPQTFAVSGAYIITAIYSGDPQFQGSTAPAITETVSTASYVFYANVQTTSPGEYVTEVFSASDSTYYINTGSYFTGPGARFFSTQYSTEGIGVGGTGVAAAFSPTYVPADGKPITATMHFSFSGCTAIIVNGVYEPDYNNCFAGNGSLAVAGIVTGSISAPAQIQFFPTKAVPIVAAPGSSSVATDSSGNIYAGFGAQVEKFSGGTFTTIAGTGIAGFSGNGGPAVNAQVNSVEGLLAEPNGKVILVDSGSNTARVIDTSNIIQPYAGTYYPEIACEDYNGNGQLGFEFGASCYSGQTSQANAPQAATATLMGGPNAIATDGINVFLSDPDNDTVRMVDYMGNITTIAGYAICGGYVTGMYGTTQCYVYPGYKGDGGPGAGPTLATSAQIDTPNSLAVSPYGDLDIATNGVVRKLSPAGTISTISLNGTPLPQGGLAFDHTGNLYITGGPNILKVSFDTNGNPVSMSNWAVYDAGSSGGYDPVIDDTGRMIIADGVNINQIGGTGFLAFPPVDPGFTSQPLTATITNPGGNNLVIASANSIGGPNAADFKISTDTCTGASISPADTCMVSATFTPSANSSETATITVLSNVGSGTQTIQLSGSTAGGVALTTPAVPGSAKYGVNISPPITATASGGVPPYAFTSSLNSSNGNWTLTQNGATITISGAPKVTGNLPFTIVATDSNGATATSGATLPVTLITVASPFVPSGALLGQPIGPNQSVGAILSSATGGTRPYTFSISFPPASGQWSVSTPNGATAIITGTPLQAGNIAFTITAVDSLGGTSSPTSGMLTVGPESILVDTLGTQTLISSGTTLQYSANLLLLNSFVSGQPLPIGTVQFSLDNQPVSTATVTAGTTPSNTVTTDILFHTLAANYGGDTNYNSSSGSYSINGNRSQSITFPGGLSFPAGSTIALTAFASSGLPVIYSVLSGSASLDPTGLNLVTSGPGLIQVQATQPGNASFAPAPAVIATFTAY
jgi:hypothetical protein